MKKITIKNKILILFSFLFILIGTFTISSFAYHEDDNGNLVSDNLINYKDINSDKFTDLGNNSFKLDWRGAVFTITLPYNDFDENTQYSLTITKISGAGYCFYQFFWNYTDNTSERFTNNQGVGDGTYSFTSALNKTLSSITIVLNYEADFKDLMLNVGSPKSFEPYGQIFYSHDTLNKVSRYNYGPFSYATNIKLTYNNGSSSFIYKNYSNIYDLTLESFIGFGNQCIIVNDYKFIFSILGGNANWTYTFNFTFANNSIKVSDFNEWYFYGPITYSFTSGSTNFSNSGSGNPEIITLTEHNFSSSSYITNFSFTRKNPYYGGLSSTKVGTPNSTLGYDNGYINGFDDATSQITESYSAIIKKYESTIKTLSDRVSYLENANRNYTNLIWAIGATPWESFKHIWNVEFGGINIASIVTGLVTALLVIYLIKKIWK